MNVAYLSLGSNIGDREAHLKDAISRLREHGQVLSVSCFYETEPVEFTDQGWFLNCALALETDETAQQLMTSLLRIEQEMGRKRGQNKGPRIIDLDILLFGDAVVSTAELTIPHPAMAGRRFVLEPLVDIAREVRHPVLKKTVRELRDGLPKGQEVRRISSGTQTANFKEE